LTQKSHERLAARDTRFTEKRRSLRHPFTATAVVTELESRARVSGRAADLTREGCYIDAMSSFPAGTTVMLRLVKEKQAFDTHARVVHAQVGMGMSLAFAMTEPEEQYIVENWISEASGGVPPPSETAFADRLPQGKSQAESAQVLKYLILKLVQKQVLADDEGITLLEKLGVLPSSAL
jgi:PilZ domain